jgi:hypothetical protein
MAYAFAAYQALAAVQPPEVNALAGRAAETLKSGRHRQSSNHVFTRPPPKPVILAPFQRPESRLSAEPARMTQRKRCWQLL